MDDLGIAMGLRGEALLAWFSNPITQLLLLPVIGGLLVSLTPREQLRRIRVLALTFTALTVVVVTLMLTGVPEGVRQSVPLLAGYSQFRPDAGFQFGLPPASYRWMAIQFGEAQSFAVSYEVGIDGISMPLIAMSTVIFLLAAIWSLTRRERVREYFALFMLLQIGTLGIFVALDFVLFYLFWELMLIPMFFLIAGWGADRERAARAAIKFFVFTIAGSVFYLIAFIALKIYSNVYSFSIPEIQQASLRGDLMYLPFEVRLLMFVGLFLAFAVKIPMFPFHTWLPEAHTEAPTEMSVILAAVMLKTGAYGMLRICYLMMPDMGYHLGPIIAGLSVVAIVYGAAITLVQTDFKRMVAYSSISHMGFITLGISAMNVDATVGAVFHMVGHGVIIAALFFLAGVLKERFGTLDMREMSAFGQLAPSYAPLLSLAAFAAMGFPLLMGFWGEFLVLRGTFFNSPVWSQISAGGVDGSTFLRWCAVIAVLGILITAVYMLNMLMRVLFSKVSLPVLVPSEALSMRTLVAAAVGAGTGTTIRGAEMTAVSAEAESDSDPPSAPVAVPSADPLDVELARAPSTDPSGNALTPWRGLRLHHALTLLPLTAAMLLFFFWPGLITRMVEVVAGGLYLIQLGS